MTTNTSQSFTTIAAVVLGVIVVLILLWRCINILRQYERGVVFRLGRAMRRERGPGFVFIFWPIDRLVRVENAPMVRRCSPLTKAILRPPVT